MFPLVIELEYVDASEDGPLFIITRRCSIWICRSDDVACGVMPAAAIPCGNLTAPVRIF